MIDNLTDKRFSVPSRDRLHCESGAGTQSMLKPPDENPLHENHCPQWTSRGNPPPHETHAFQANIMHMTVQHFAGPDSEAGKQAMLEEL